MKKGKCIYCKKYKNLNREHAFPKSLLQKGAPGWTIKKHVCVDCNSKLAQLDAVLIKKSPLAFVWDRIQDELGHKTQTPHSSIYHKKAGGINPLRQFFPDSHYENHIILHETTTVNSGTSVPVDSATALRPQIILTQYPEGQTSEAIIAKNCEKFNNTSSDQDIITDYDKQEEVYCIFGNTYIFPPKTSERFFYRIQEFKSKFMKDFPRTRYNLMIIFPEQDKDQRAIETFCNSFKAGTKEIIEDEKIPDPIPVIQLIEVRADPKAIPDIARAIAKIAFHCFLHHYPEFNGHESIFDDIREFIYVGSPNKFVGDWKNPGTENLVYDSSEHLHGICFFLQDNDIGCRMDLFTGLRTPSVSYQVILAGEPDNSHPSPSRVEYIPFYVHPKSQMKKRILPVENLGIIRPPSQYEGVLWLPKYPL